MAKDNFYADGEITWKADFTIKGMTQEEIDNGLLNC